MAESHFAWVLMIFAIASSLGAVVCAKRGTPKQPGRLWLWSLLFDGVTHVPLILVGWIFEFPGLCVMVFIHALFMPFILIARTYFIQMEMPAEDRAKMFALINFSVLGVTGISIKVTGVLIEQGVSPAACFAWGGVLAMLPGFWGLMDKRLKNLGTNG